MAPMALNTTLPMKRAFLGAEFNPPRRIKQRQRYAHHHQLQYKQLVDGETGEIHQDDASAQSQLSRSILLALRAVGFEGADALALESFRALVEEHMRRLFAGVRVSMLSSRRTQAIPQDFLYTIHSHQLTLRALLPHLDPPVLPSKSQPPLSRDVTEDEDPKNAQLINTMLNGKTGRITSNYVPPHFPALPSQHTYKAKAVFIQRDHDPRTLRERATEESRLGEEALRKLVGVGIGGRSACCTSTSQSGKKRLDRRERADDVWKQTMTAVASGGHDGLGLHDNIHDPGGFAGASQPGNEVGLEIGPPVNADRVYWRKAIPSRPNTIRSHGDLKS